MEPINKKERAMNIKQFVLLFMLAIIPICAAVYFFARIDPAENSYLRQQATKYADVQEDTKAIDDTLRSIVRMVTELDVTLKSAASAPSASDISGEVGEILRTGRYENIHGSLTALDGMVGKDKKGLVDLLFDMHKCLEQYNKDVYVGVYKEMETQRTNANLCGTQKQQLKVLAQEYQVPYDELKQY